MDAKTYFKVSGINLMFLLAGVLIGPPVISTSRFVFDTVVHAQSKENPDRPPAKVEAPTALDPNFEWISPAVTLGGPVVTNTLLANRIACDRFEVNSFEPLKLNDAILSLLARKGIASPAEIQAIVDAGKATKPLRIKPSPPR